MLLNNGYCFVFCLAHRASSQHWWWIVKKKTKKTKPFGEFSWWYSTARFRKDGWATTPSPPPHLHFFFLFNVFLRRHYPDRTGKILMMERSLDDRLCCSLRRRKKKETIDAIPMKIQSILVFLFASCLFFFNGYINFNVSMRLNRFCHVYRPLINYYNVGKERFFVRLFRTQQFQSNLFLNPWRHFIYSF